MEITRYRIDHLMYAAGDNMWNTIRTGITLTEPIDVSALEYAVGRLPLRFPYFAVKLIRDGESLFYESNHAPFVISENGEAVTLGSARSNGHLVAFAYKDNTIYIDSSHFLMDGSGQFPFIKMLLYEYLHVRHPEEQFDVSNIPQPGDNISHDEMTDEPYPEEELDAGFPLLRRAPHKIFTLDDQPTGYDHMDSWTSYQLKIKQAELMKYASSTDGSPATFISSAIYRAISDLNPDNRLPIVCGMQHQFRKALGNSRSHSSHVRIVPIEYPYNVRNKELTLINTMGRGTLLIHAADDQDIYSINEYIRNRRRINSMSLAQKQKLMQKVVHKAIGKNTFEVSYTGRVQWSGLDKYITRFSPYIDLTLSGGISVEIFALGEYFDINIMQRCRTDKYVNGFSDLLKELEICCIQEDPESFRINCFQAIDLSHP